MARAVGELIVVVGELLALTPVHVGGAGGAVESDLALAVDGEGNFYIPGTSLAGAIRAFVVSCFGQQAAGGARSIGVMEELWGRGPSKAGGELPGGTNEGKPDPNDGMASRIVVHDARAIGGPVAESRDHVGLERFSGTAADGIKFDRQILPKYTRFSFRMEVEKLAASAETADDESGHIALIAQALSEGRIRFGGAKTRGLGKLKLVDGRVECFAVGRRGGILDLVRSRARAKGDVSASTVSQFVRTRGGTPSFPPRLVVKIDWEPDGPVMVKSDTDGLGVDMLPLVSGVGGDELAMVIPGSAIKGRLRAHAERIAATVFDKDLSPRQNEERLADLFSRRLTRVPLLVTLFGVGGPPKGKEEAYRQIGAGAVHVDDCFADQQSITREQWQTLAAAPSDDNGDMSAVTKALSDMKWGLDNDGARAYPAAHVAIDRWTGGAADKQLFTALEPEAFNWSPIELEVTLDRLKVLGSDPGAAFASDAAISLLLLTLKDFARGRLPLGFGGNRGYGSVRVKSIAFLVDGAASPAVQPLDDWSLSLPAELDADLHGTEDWFAAHLAEAARLSALNERWTAYQQAKEKAG